MPETYEGLALGGPHAGKNIKAFRKSIFLFAMPPVSLRQPADSDRSHVAPRLGEYSFVAGMWLWIGFKNDGD